MNKVLPLILLMMCIRLGATHNKAGEITYKQLDELTIEATITTYTNSQSPASEDRDSLRICWGDSNCEMILRVNGIDGKGMELGNNYRLNIYRSAHTYSDTGAYIISMTDPNRDHDILNINFPHSSSVPFHLETYFQLREIGEQEEFNGSPTFLQMPIDYGFVGLPFQHIPHAIDAEGDSLSYSLVNPLGSLGESVINYDPVTEIGAGPMNKITLNEISGEINWDAPQISGSYVIAVEIASYKMGRLVDKIIRDFQIIVHEIEDSIAMPPLIQIEGIDHYDILSYSVGQTFNWDVLAQNESEKEDVFLSSSSELYENNQAEFIVSDGVGQFKWTVEQDDIRAEPYLVIFKATDTYMPNGMTRYKVLVFDNEVLSETESIQRPTEMVLFPNPVEEVIYISIEGQSLVGDYTIFSTTGKLMQKGTLSGIEEGIDVKTLFTGNYVLVFRGSGQVRVVSFFKK